jgi:hypothetical protein
MEKEITLADTALGWQKEVSRLHVLSRYAKIFQ